MPTATDQPLHPLIEWAQRKDIVFVTIGVDDCNVDTLKIVDNNKLVFKGIGGCGKSLYECEIELFAEVEEEFKQLPGARSVPLVLTKKEKGNEYWPRLLKTKQKCHYLKVDFGKWKDEDDEEMEEGSQFDINNMMSQMGGMGNMGDYKPSMDDLEYDSDDNEEGLPDLEDDEELKEKSKEGEKVEAQNGDDGAKPDEPVAAAEATS